MAESKDSGEKPEGFYVVESGKGVRHHKPEQPSEARPHTEGDPSKLTWAELMSKKERPSHEDDMGEIDDAINNMLNEAEDNGVLDEGRIRIANAIRESDWNHVAQDLFDQSGNMERAGEERLYPPDKKEKYKGMLRTLTEGVAARIAVAGLEQKKEEEGGTLPEDWKNKHGFTDRMIGQLQRNAYIKHGEVLLPAGAELLVGENFRREREISQPPGWVDQDTLEKYFKRQEEVVNALKQGQQQLMLALGNQQLALDQFLQRSGEQTEILVDSFSGGSPEQERERWTDVEYEQGFYTRFQPDHEPRFYKNMDKKERDDYDARWQLARAAFFKGATSSFPEKQIENQDLTMMKKEHLERLYNIPGVKEMLEAYCSSLVDPNSPFWQISDEKQFERFRINTRNRALSSSGLSGLSQKEADAIAWNLIWVSNLVESIDSRYSPNGSGGRHGGLPGILVSDDIRATFHPQEKFEDKCNKGQEWGPFGKWGKTQIGLIKQKFSAAYEDMRFIAARKKGEYWSSRRTGGKVEVSMPECYPTVTMKSFLEETKMEIVINGDKKEVPLLDVILGKVPGVRDIDWDAVGADPWIGYLPIKLNKTVKLMDYFAGKTPLEIDKPGGTKTWADPLIDVYTRLGFTGIPKDRVDLQRQFHNLKVWVAYASTGGVKNPENKQPEFNLTWQDIIVLNSALNSNKIRYFQKEGLNLN